MRRLVLATLLLGGCLDYERLSAELNSDAAFDSSDTDGEVLDGALVEDGAVPADMLADASVPPGGACTVGDGGTGIMSTTGKCLPAGCSNGSVMIGLSPPLGTVGSPPPAFGSAANVFDGDVCSGWNTGAQSGTLTLMFPSPITFSRVQVANGATPTTNEPYTFYGHRGGTWVQIGSATYAVGPYAPQNPTSVTPGTYDGLQLVVGTSGSSILILEVTLAQ
jgi:hypothetical protein